MGKKADRAKAARIRAVQKQYADPTARPAPVRPVRERGPDADGPPPESVDAYVEIYAWAMDHPQQANAIKALTDHDIAFILLGIAYRDHYGFSEQQCLDQAHNLLVWAVLNGVWYLYEWPEPVAMLKPEQIAAKIRADAAAGLIARPPGALVAQAGNAEH